MLLFSEPGNSHTSIKNRKPQQDESHKVIKHLPQDQRISNPHPHNNMLLGPQNLHQDCTPRKQSITSNQVKKGLIDRHVWGGGNFLADSTPSHLIYLNDIFFFWCRIFRIINPWLEYRFFPSKALLCKILEPPTPSQKKWEGSKSCNSERRAEKTSLRKI